jgi:hypothetical protein
MHGHTYIKIGHNSLKECHHNNIHFREPEYPTVEQRMGNHDHFIKPKDADISSSTPGYFDPLIGKTISLKLYPYNMKRNE